jgi:hypothetical protein
MKPERSRFRSPRITQAYNKHERSYREAIAQEHKIEDLLDFLRNNIPQFNHISDNGHKRLRKFLYITGSSVFVYFYGLPVDQIIEHFAGPIHRMYGVDWTMEADYSDVNIKTWIDPPGFGGKEIRVWLIACEAPGCRIVVTGEEATSYTTKKYAVHCV